VNVPGYCACAVPEHSVHEGRLMCDRCGEPVADPLLLRVFRELLAVRRQVAELERKLTEPKSPAPEWLAPKELALLLGRSLDFVYRHADELGVMRVGDGPRPRLLFPVSSDAFRRDSDGTAISPGGRGQSPS
jgi:hypothetical protein